MTIRVGLLRWLLAIPVLAVSAGACLGSSSGGGGGGSSDAAEALTKGLDFGAQATVTEGSLPQGSSGGPGVTPPSGAQPLEIKPGEPATFMIPWQGGAISGVNIGFGGSAYFAVPAPSAQGKTQGTVAVTAQVSNSVCSNLSDICHQIQCYEQVVLPGGATVSVASAMQVVLNCSGKDCNGNPADAGSGDGGSCGHPTCNQYCDCIGNNQGAFSACDQTAVACSNACYKNDPNPELCVCNQCAPPMIACMEQFCPPITAECAPHFTGC